MHSRTFKPALMQPFAPDKCVPFGLVDQRVVAALWAGDRVNEDDSGSMVAEQLQQFAGQSAAQFNAEVS